MTIQGLHALLRSGLGRSKRLLKISEFQTLHFGIDGTLQLMYILYSMVSLPNAETEQIWEAVKAKWQHMLQWLLTHGALSVTVVLDGKERRKEKALVHELRARRREKAEARLDSKLKDPELSEEERDKIQVRLLLMSQKIDVEQVSEWTRQVEGCQAVIAQHEADPVLAQMVHDGKIQAICSDDSDFLAYPYPEVLLLRHLVQSATNDRSGLECWDKRRILQELKMDPNQFLDFCVLVGCDYAPRGWLMGPTKVLKIMQQYGSLERFIQRCQRAYPTVDAKPDKKTLKLEPHARYLSEKYITTVRAAKKLFLFC